MYDGVDELAQPLFSRASSSASTILSGLPARPTRWNPLGTNERRQRSVGFDTAEAGLLARCARERELADRASARLQGLIAGGGLELRLVPCACPPGTEGMRECNHGRSCGILTAHRRDVGATMIQEGIARPYTCGRTSCPPQES
jgi:micrococcal nuclease